MKSAGGDGHDVAGAGWYVGLAVATRTPDEYSAIGAQCHAIGPSRRDGNHIRQHRRDVRWRHTESPTDHPTIHPHCQGVVIGHRDAHDVALTCGNHGGTDRPTTPYQWLAIGLNGEANAEIGSDPDDIAQGRWHECFLMAVRPPGHHPPVTFESQRM